MDEIIQGSDAWFAARLGKVTASRVSDIVAKTKSGPSASRANYLAQLVAERLTGTATESFTNDAMRWGTAQEPEARATYEFYRDVAVDQIGFVIHPAIAESGASPDGLIGADGLLEIKCPNTATHIETLIGRTVPGKYVTQIQWQLACTSRAWCDFASYDPRLPEEMRLYVERVTRDDAMIADLEREVADFLSDLDGKVAQLQALYGLKAAA